MNIEFAADDWYDQQRREVVWFSAIVDDKCVECDVSIDAACSDDPLPSFRRHRAQIQAITSKLIAARRFEDDGTIIIRSADLKPA